MVIIQEPFLIKIGLQWRAYSMLNHCRVTFQQEIKWIHFRKCIIYRKSKMLLQKTLYPITCFNSAHALKVPKTQLDQAQFDEIFCQDRDRQFSSVGLFCGLHPAEKVIHFCHRMAAGQHQSHFIKVYCDPRLQSKH